MQTPMEEIRALLINDGIQQQKGNKVSKSLQKLNQMVLLDICHEWS